MDGSERQRPAERPWTTGAAPWERWLGYLVRLLSGSRRGSAGYGRARGVLHVFQFAEYVTNRRHTLYPLRADGVVRYEIGALPSSDLPLADGHPVHRGEQVIILHFDNRAIAKLASTMPSTQALLWSLVRLATQDLQVLATHAAAGQFPPGVRAVWGSTVLYQALARYGFHTRRVAHAPFQRLFMLGMEAIYGRDGAMRLVSDPRGHVQVGEAWMSLDELQRRYGSVRVV